MMLPLFTYFILFIIIFVTGHQEFLVSESNLLDHARLIVDVQEYFSASSVFVVNAGHYESPTELLLMSQLSREFSRKLVLSQNINFTKLNQEIPYYSGRTVQPLFIVILHAIDDLYHFSISTKSYNMAWYKWLVIFDEKINETELANYCIKPDRNLLNLVVTSKMLVRCKGQNIIQEWYSIDGRSVVIQNYAIWNNNGNGLTRLVRRDFHERRSNLQGIPLRVSTVQNNVRRGDFFTEVLFELSKKMNFSITYVSEEDSYGVLSNETGKWTGVIGKLAAKETDIGCGEFTMNRQRISVVDYTVPLMLTFSDIYIKRPNMTFINWSSYTKAFHKDIWIIIITILMTVPLILALLCKTTIKGSEITCHYLGEKYLHIWGIYCQKSLPEFPASSSLRIAYISIFASSLILYAVYSAYLTSYLTVFTPVMPFSSYGGFVADGTYKLIVLRKSATQDMFTHAEIPIFSKMAKLLKEDDDLPYNIYEAINQVCNERVVLFTNQVFIEKISRYAPCEVMPVTKGRLDNLGFVLTKNSPYTEIVNYNLKSLRTYGIIERLKRRYLKKFEHIEAGYLPVSLLSVMPIVGILCLGLAVSIGVLGCEHAAYHRRERALRIHGKVKRISAVVQFGIPRRRVR